MKILHVAPALSLAFLVGCMAETPEIMTDKSFEDLQTSESAYANELESEPDFYNDLQELLVQNATLEGAIGPVDGIGEMAVTTQQGFGEERYAAIFTVSESDENAAMTIVEVLGGIAHESLIAGAEFTFDDMGISPNTDMQVLVIGCSGEEADQWDFDKPAEEVNMSVSEHPENPNMLRVNYEARYWTFNGPDTIANGSFDVER